jgi:uncharacterized protein (TIGR00369 family)
MPQDKNNAVHTRNRIIEWQDPGAIWEQANGLSLLGRIRAIRDGKLPPPPIACLIGFHYVGAEPGEIVIELQPDHSLESSAGTLHAGVAATMLDTAMSAAAGTLLPINKGAVTLDLNISYLKPLTSESGPIVPSVALWISPNGLHTRRATSAMGQAIWPLMLSVSSR